MDGRPGTVGACLSKRRLPSWRRRASAFWPWCPTCLRPWLFRIAHNTAVDFLRRYEHTHVEPVAAPPEPLPAGEAVDPYAVRSALLSFLALPVLQRSAVILKDVLGHSLGGIASTIGTTVPAVKAALARGRSKLRQMGAQGPETREGAMAADELEDLRRYARLFNATRLGRCPRAAGRRVPA